MSTGAAKLLLRRRTSVTTPPPDGVIPDIAAWGDSLTNQIGYTNYIQSELATYYGQSTLDVYRGGRGSQRSEGIAARQGGRNPLLQAVIIPDSGPVVISFTNNVDFLNNSDTNPDVLNCLVGTPPAIAGTVRKVPQAGNVDCWAFEFTRSVAGTARAIATGEPMVMNTAGLYRPRAHVIRAGHNDRNPRPCTGGIDDLAAVPPANGTRLRVRAMWDYAMAVASKAIVVSLITADPIYLGAEFDSLSADCTSVNSAWAAEYGADYCNLRAYLSSKQALLDGGILMAANGEPTVEDQKGIDLLYPPRSFQEGIHLNAAGQMVSGKFVAAFIIGRNWQA